MDQTIDDRQGVREDVVGEKILAAAVAIVEKEGYENLKIRRVAKESGCSNTAIYMRFEDKDALARAVAALHARPFLHLIDEFCNMPGSFCDNMNRLLAAAYDKVVEMDLEAVHMQVDYRGSMKIDENPFVLKLENYIKAAFLKGELKNANFRIIAYTIECSFWGTMCMLRANRKMERSMAVQIMEKQISILYDSVREADHVDVFWTSLKYKGVDVDKALERMKGNKEAYKSFLMEFFEDPDFEAVQESLDKMNAKDAYDYAHGLKGMAANLGLEEIHTALSELVDILRQGSLEGTQEAYTKVKAACDVIKEMIYLEE